MLNAMIIINFIMNYGLARLVRPLRGGLHDFFGTWRQPSLQLSPRGGEGDRSLSLWEMVRVRVGNSSEWNDHSASLRLALHMIFHELQLVESRSPLGHPKNRTLHPVQPFLGLCVEPVTCSVQKRSGTTVTRARTAKKGNAVSGFRLPPRAWWNAAGPGQAWCGTFIGVRNGGTAAPSRGRAGLDKSAPPPAIRR